MGKSTDHAEPGPKVAVPARPRAAAARWLSRGLLVSSFLLLLGCVDPATPTVVSEGGVGPGATAAPVMTASALFRQVCIDTAPRLDAARTALSKLPFTQNPTTGTYYHNMLDLSIKVRREGGRGVCSIVFASTEPPERVGKELARMAIVAGLVGMQVEVGADEGVAGRNYYSVFAISP